MTPNLSLLVDLVMVGLLVATIAYAIILNKQIVKLRDSRSELAELIRGLNEATAQADAGVKGMRRAASDTGEQLQRAIDKAAALRDELTFMVEAGEALADRLGATGGDRARPAAPAPSRAVARPAVAPPVRTAPASPLIDETLTAARAEAARRDPAAAQSPGGDGPRPRDGQDGMSRAERELLQAIENRR